MSEHDDGPAGRTEPPEFVAVTPRGVVPPLPPEREPEPTTTVDERPAAEAEPAAEREAAPEGAETQSADAMAAGTDSTESQPVESQPVEWQPVQPRPLAAEPVEPGPLDADSAHGVTHDAAAGEADRGADSPSGEEAAAGPAAAATPPAPPPVTARVAAEGLADALAGIGTPGMGGIQRGIDRIAVATTTCAVLALAAGTLLAITAYSNSHHRAVAAARVAALAAAKRETAQALTYNYKTLNQDFARAEAGMSRTFRADYAKTAATSVAPLAQKTHAVTTGTIAAAGVESAGPDHARILVFADQTVQNTLLNATSRLDRSVIEVFMVKQDGRWVINDLQPF
jgi:Mce-associated membrane protein